MKKAQSEGHVVKPSKNFKVLEDSSSSVKKGGFHPTTATKHESLVKKELGSPIKNFNNSSAKISLHSANSNTKLAASVGKASSSKNTPKKSSKDDTEKKEKKVYELPGQKHDPPDERDPLRIFYESLYQQNPKSEMAQVWMMEHGLLAPDAAKKALERKKRNQLNQKMGSPVKTFKGVMSKSENVISKKIVWTSEKKSSTSNGDTKQSLKVKRKFDLGGDSDDDLILKPKKKLSTSA